jgi:hypothetical protein
VVGALRRGRVWIAAGVVLLTGLVLVGLGVRGASHPLAAPAPSSAAPAAETAPTAVALAAGRSAPETLHIPDLGLSVPVGSLGLDADGSVQVPSNTVEAAWFRLGPTPGQIGSAVILGHVDSAQGPGVYFRLGTLAPGDQVDVDLADGMTARFTVNSVAQYTKARFPAQRVHGSHGSSALQLVTCGGVFDHQSGSHLSNVVVYTSLSAVTPTVPTPTPGPPTT